MSEPIARNIESIGNSADAIGRNLNSDQLDQHRVYFASGLLRIKAAGIVTANSVTIIQQTSEKYLISNQLIRLEGGLYSTRNFAAFIRELDYFLRVSTYAMLCGDVIGYLNLSKPALVGLVETSIALGVPANVTMKAVQVMKEIIISFVGDEVEQEVGLTFDYLCSLLSEARFDDQDKIYRTDNISKENNRSLYEINRETWEPKNYNEWLNLDRLAQQLQNNKVPEENERDSPLARKLVGRSFSRQERIQLELDSLFSYFEQRRNLLERSLTAPEVAKLLGTSRQTPHDLLKNQTLLGVLDRGAYRFPIWQFDAEGADGVIEGLPEVLRALKVSDFDKLSWLVHPNPILDGLTPVEALKKGKKEQVIEEAVGIGVL